MTDSDFGNLLFMHLYKWPERSYWECEWSFPKISTVVGIVIRGGGSIRKSGAVESIAPE